MTDQIETPKTNYKFVSPDPAKQVEQYKNDLDFLLSENQRLKEEIQSSYGLAGKMVKLHLDQLANERGADGELIHPKFSDLELRQVMTGFIQSGRATGIQQAYRLAKELFGEEE